MFDATLLDSSVAAVMTIVIFSERMIPIKCEAVDLFFLTHAEIITYKSDLFPAPSKMFLRGSSDLVKVMVLFLDKP